jgi:hypothetical protein
MSPASATPEERFAALVEAFLGQPGVTHASAEASGKQRFGASALKVYGKIFAMPVKGRLVVKLPRQRVDALIASGDGERFDPGHGRVMKEWLSLEPGSDADWLSLAKEAMDFVAGSR